MPSTLAIIILGNGETGQFNIHDMIKYLSLIAFSSQVTSLAAMPSSISSSILRDCYSETVVATSTVTKQHLKTRFIIRMCDCMATSACKRVMFL